MPLRCRHALVLKHLEPRINRVWKCISTCVKSLLSAATEWQTKRGSITCPEQKGDWFISAFIACLHTACICSHWNYRTREMMFLQRTCAWLVVSAIDKLLSFGGEDAWTDLTILVALVSNTLVTPVSSKWLCQLFYWSARGDIRMFWEIWSCETKKL
jgi:hypothetical protein